MKENLNNPSAFPQERHGWVKKGMTLRDYFAAKAINGILSAQTEMRANGNYNDDICISALAKEAYDIANSMLKQREL